MKNKGKPHQPHKPHDFSAFPYSKILAAAYGGELGESKNTEVVLYIDL